MLENNALLVQVQKLFSIGSDTTSLKTDSHFAAVDKHSNGGSTYVGRRTMSL